MTREEERRLRGRLPGWPSGREAAEAEEGGPDPTEDPIAYLQERRDEEER